MLLVIYMGLLALSDITVPAMAIQIQLGKHVGINKATYVSLFILIILNRILIPLNFIIYDVFIYFVFLFISVKKYHVFADIKYSICIFVITNILIILIINFVYRYFSYGFSEYDFVYSDILPNTDLDFIRKMLFLVFILFIKNNNKNKLEIFEKKYWHHLYVFSILCFLSIVLLAGRAIHNDNKGFYFLYSTLAGIIVVLMYMFHNFFITLYDNILKNQELCLENEKTRMQLNSLLEEQNHIEEVKKFHHDMKNNFIVLQHLIDNHDISQVKAYLNNYINEFKCISQGLQIDNVIVNAIVNNKIRVYTKLIFDIKCQLPKRILMDDLDLAIIVGNLLDNSCEHLECNHLNERIYVKIFIHMDNVLFVEIKNVYVDRLVSTKESKITKNKVSYHGYGLINVQKVVNKYKGTYAVKIEEGYFITNIMIPNMIP